MPWLLEKLVLAFRKAGVAFRKAGVGCMIMKQVNCTCLGAHLDVQAHVGKRKENYYKVCLSKHVNKIISELHMFWCTPRCPGACR